MRKSGLKQFVSLAFMLTTATPTFTAEPWAATPVPGIAQQEFRFANGDTQLVGTLYMPICLQPYALKVPSLFIYGAADPWVPVASSMARLKDLAKHKPDMPLYEIEGADHTMMPPSESSLSMDPNTLGKEAPSVPAYFMILSGWLARQVR